jgi:hypothetical protein
MDLDRYGASKELPLLDTALEPRQETGSTREPSTPLSTSPETAVWEVRALSGVLADQQQREGIDRQAMQTVACGLAQEVLDLALMDVSLATDVSRFRTHGLSRKLAAEKLACAVASDEAVFLALDCISD